MTTEAVRRFQLNAGDHVCLFWKTQSKMDHGIFLGGDKIIHLVEPKMGSGCFHACGKKKKSRCPKSYCGREKVAGSRVRMCCLDCYIKEDGDLHRFMYGFEWDHPVQVIDRANYLYENKWCLKHKQMNLGNNCRFAYYCRTGLYSTQPQSDDIPILSEIFRKEDSSREWFRSQELLSHE